MWYLWKVNKNDVEALKNSELQHVFFITDSIEKNMQGLIKIGKHGFIKATLIKKNIDRNKLISYVMKKHKIK